MVKLNYSNFAILYALEVIVLFGKIKKKVANHMLKHMEEFEHYVEYELNCKHCVYYNLIVDTGDVVVDECLKIKCMDTPSNRDYVVCNYFKHKKEKKTNLFGVNLEDIK